MEERYPYPRVTEVIAWAFPSPVLWHPEYLRRGTFVHAAADILGNGDDLDDRTMETAFQTRMMPSGKQEAWHDYLQGYRLFLDECVPRKFVRIVHPTDTRIVNEVERYTGKPDQVWMMDDGRECVIDLKTGHAPASVRLQLAAYDLALPHERRRRRFALELTPNAYRLIACEDDRDYAAWRLLVRAHWIVKGKEYAG